MAELWKDGFDHYGGLTANMLSGPYAEVSGILGAPAYGARTGTYAYGITTSSTLRRVLNGSPDPVVCSIGFTAESLPRTNDLHLMELRDSGNNPLSWITVNTDGSLTFTAGANTVSTQGPVIKAGTWHHIEAKFSRAANTVLINVDEIAVINSGITFPVTAATQIAFTRSSTAEGPFWIDDIIVRDTTGTFNNGIEGDLRVATLFPNSDGALQGWTPQPRKKIGTGILDNATTPGGVTAASASILQLGAADYTLETFVRVNSLPTLTNTGTIFSKWQADSAGNREWHLFLSGPNLGTHDTLTLEISTTGQTGGDLQVFSWPWVPDLNVWYHVAVVRSASEVLLFINGVQQGTPFPDAHTYFAGSGSFAIGASMVSSTGIDTTSQLDAWFDEVRITPGVARYIANFTPTTVAFPRNSTGDPNFASVAVLAGFDNGIVDESSFARPLTARNGAAQFLVDDGAFNYQTIDQASPRDDTYIEADIVTATGTFELDAVPTAGETVTLGSTKYTFRAAVSVANDVAIGASATATLSNLVAAIMAGTGAGTAYGTGTVANAQAHATTLPVNQIAASAITPGAAGNSIATTETCANGQWIQGATLTGGQDIPGPSEFGFERLSENTTILRSLTIVHRAYKSDAGTADIKVSLIDASGNEAAGTAHPLTVNPTFYEQIFDTDPTTGGGLTPLMLLGARVRVERTD